MHFSRLPCTTKRLKLSTYRTKIVNDPYVTKGIAENTTPSIDLEKATDAHKELRTEIIQEKENNNHD